MNVNGVVPALPSFSETSEMEMAGMGSSPVMVPVPLIPESAVPAVLLLRPTVKVSFGSNLASPLTVTLKSCVVMPAGKFSVCVLAT